LAVIKICRVFAIREDNVWCPLHCKAHSDIQIKGAGVSVEEEPCRLEVWAWTYYSAEENTQMQAG